MTLTELAPAKINLGLRILRKRPDGFHDLLSIFQTVSLFDELELSGEGSGLSCDRDDLSCGPDNLVLRAERVFREETGYDRPVLFMLRKRIPTGAGLGGGSSDAAAALRGLRRMSGLSLSPEFMHGLASRLGSDVPFLLDGGTAVVEGRGERIAPVFWPFDFTGVLVYPGFGVSTGWAYCQVRSYAGENTPLAGAAKRLAEGILDRETFLAAVHNDFEPAIFPHHPLLAEIKDGLSASGAAAAFLTGSGSTLVGLFDAPDTAHQCAAQMKNRGFDVFVVRATTA